ncbi:putative CheA signal transduction histidine kinase [Solidesulfovibrio fructosivorans JJ]]|uniref:Putative CheA signal transduction histidine kinase n=1 Tax=Solidesulfovibrio fructosivorans JJ] TaxID=596151 RepID=E1K1K5_SOLFR|nr:Hpt domain-containing protein [Solidesulfovibrio fructosivorans]EFL49499.1 putative CheA signal transduction histidine kinase [Solidesulfovibrio fructosivorans JJ]]
MDAMDDEIMAMFVEDTREHLADIESALMDMESDGADIDEELVNKVFRAAHSIKGGASFLNLNNIRDLAHKLENVLHMVRSRELAPDTRIINRLLAGFDRLLGLVEDAATSDAADIADVLAALSGITTEHLSSEARAEAAAAIPIALPGGEVVFTEDRLSLRQATAGGKNLYLVEYDLIHDVQARGKTPLDIITTMESSGLIVDCRMELAAVGDLDAPPVNRIPFYVLFASIVEPDIVGYLFALDAARIHPVDAATLAEAPAAGGDAAAVRKTFGDWELTVTGASATLRLAAGARADAASAREALLAALARGAGASLVLPAPGEIDLTFLQVLVAAAKSFAARGLPLGHDDGAPAALAETAARAGVTPASLAEAGVTDKLFFAS